MPLDHEETVAYTKRLLHVLEDFNKYLFEYPEMLQQVLRSLTEAEHHLILELLCITKPWSGTASPTTVTLIESILRGKWILQAQVIENLEPRTRRAVAAQLSEETRNTIAKVLFFTQKVSELEFTTGGEYMPDIYVVTGEWPDHFPIRLRTCSLCGLAYRPFDSIEMSDELCESSCHEDGSCPSVP